MRLGGRKHIQSVRSTWSILHSELKACVLALLKGNNKGCKMDTHTHKLIAAGDRLQYAKTR